MGYDVGASILQGWKLNDFFEGYCMEEVELIYSIFEEDEEDEQGNSILKYEDVKGTGVYVSRPDHGEEEAYIGVSSGHVSNRSGPREAIFELKDSIEITASVIAVLNKANHPLLHMIANMIPNKPLQNYLLLSESY